MNLVELLSVDKLIDMYNKECNTADCRYTTKQVNHSYCQYHDQLYKEISKRNGKNNNLKE